jgi:hypothetical protein
MTGVLIYLLILIFGLCLVAFRKQTSLLKGRSFLKFNIIFFVIVFLIMIVTRQLNENLILILFLVIITCISILLRKKWLFFKYNSQTASVIIEGCLSKILIPFQKSERGYRIKTTQENELRLDITSLWPQCAIMSFKGDVHQKKVEVLENFLVKNFSSIFPKLVIKLK